MDICQMISSFLFPQFKSWEQLLKETNFLFKWDELAKGKCQVLYEKGLAYYSKKDFKKAGELFYKAASIAENNNEQEITYKLLFCTWECVLEWGNPEPLALFTREMFSIYNDNIPRWLMNRLGLCAIAHIGYGDITKNKNQAMEYYKLGGWLFTKYFENTGEYKKFDEEWIYYVFYGWSIYKVGGSKQFAIFCVDLKKHIPEMYLRKVIESWEKYYNL